MNSTYAGEMLTVIVGLSGSLLFGGGDFFGGLASKKMGALLATAVAGLTGLILLFTFSFIVPGDISDGTVFFGLLSGVVGSLALLFVYASLAVGPMSILSPLGALVSAVLPVLWAIFVIQENIAWYGYVALVIGAIAIVLVARVPEDNAVKPTLRGIVLAVIAGILIGFFLIIIAQLPPNSGLYPLVFNRMVNITIMFGALGLILLFLWAVKKKSFEQVGPPRFDILIGDRGTHNYKKGIRLAVMCGVLDATGNSLLFWGIQIGDLSVMSILTALYPAGTIILAYIILKERISRMQLFGMVLAILAAALLAVS